MNWQPLISRWRVEAQRLEDQLRALNAPSSTHALETKGRVAALRQCANQAEKSFKRQKQRDRKARAAAEAEFLGEPGE